MGRRREPRNRQEDVDRPRPPPHWRTIAKAMKKNRGLMLLLFETPSGFALFASFEVYFHHPDSLTHIWAKFADPDRAPSVTMPKEFETFEDKSSAINADTGVHKRLAGMIYKWHLPGMKLAVGKPEYKTIIESKLGIPCMHNAIVMEVMWGIQHLMHKLVPKEKAEVAKDDRFPMSQGLKMFLSHYGFDDVEPEMLNEQILATACALFDCDIIYKQHFEFLADVSVRFKEVSDINCERWGGLKLATALKVVCFPEEDNDFHKVLSADELLKLKEEAPKYEDIFCKHLCKRAYENISSAHQVRSEKKRLLGFLVKEAKAACEKGKPHRESEQIPQEHVRFAYLCSMLLPMISALKPPYVNEPSLQKGLKRSRDSAFDPIVLNKSTFCERLSLGETGSKRIVRRSSFSGAQPSTSKAIVPYKPIPNVPLSILPAYHTVEDVLKGCSEGKYCGHYILPTEQVEVGTEATPLVSVGDSKDEAKLLAELSEQNEANNIEKQVQVHDNGGSALPPRPPKSVSRRSPRLKTSSDGKVLRRSPRLKTSSDGKVLRRSPRLKREAIPMSPQDTHP